MSRIVQLNLLEAPGATSFANKGSDGRAWTASPSAPMALGGNRGGVIFDIPGDSTRRYLKGPSDLEPVNFTIWAWVTVFESLSGYQRSLVKPYAAWPNWTDYPWVAVEMVPRSPTGTMHCVVSCGGIQYVIDSGDQTPLNRRLMVAMTFDGSTMTAYLNGASIGSVSVPGPIDYGAHGNWLCGNLPDGSSVSEPLYGLQEQVVIDSSALRADDILAIYNQGPGVTPIQPVPVPTPSQLIELSSSSETGTGVARDILLGSDGDLSVSAGDLQLARGLVAIAQSAKIRLRFFKGEWKFEESRGIPYHQSVFVTNPNLPRIRALFRECLKNTVGIKTVEEVKLDFNRQTRRATGSAIASTDLGQLVVPISLPS
jgi:hypothetical protein